MCLKKLILTVLSASVASGVVVTSNQYFDRIETPNWGTEVTFYGLGLNFSWPMNITQMMFQTFVECKNVHRVVSSYISAFAQKQSNGSVLCTYFQQPIYALPTVSADKSIALAFYKETPTLNSGLTTNALLENGKFYMFMGRQNVSIASKICKETFPNGYVLRPKTIPDFNLVFRNPLLKLTYSFAYLLLDLTSSNSSNPILTWGDGTPFDQSETPHFFRFFVSTTAVYNPAYIYTVPYAIYPTDSSSFTAYATCEVNTFSGL